MFADAAIRLPHLDLLPAEPAGRAPLATHVAAQDGDWSAPQTWCGDAVPGAGAVVHIPHGVAVTCRETPSTGVFLLRVDGALSIRASAGAEVRFVVDTLITAPGSHLVVDAAGDDAGSVEITFSEAEPPESWTDWDRQHWDPEGLTPGLIASGTVHMAGREVTASARLLESPGIGSTKLVLPRDPVGWAVGQILMIGDTCSPGPDSGQSGTETRVITALQKDADLCIVTLDQPLLHDHAGQLDPLTELELTGHVANLSRSVTLQAAPGTSGAHVLLADTDAVTLRHVALQGLGRSTPSATDPAGAERPALHLHRTHDAVIEGVAIANAPGAGIVQDHSQAALSNNVVVTTAGPAFAAIAGSETGRWTDNLALGIGAASAANGIGFLLRTPAIKLRGNTAQSCSAAGFRVDLSATGLNAIAAAALDIPGLAHGVDTMLPRDVPLRAFTGNMAIATRTGLCLNSAEPRRDCVHLDAWHHIDGFSAWNTGLTGIEITGSGRAVIEDALLLGAAAPGDSANMGTTSAFRMGRTVADVTILNGHVERFGHVLLGGSDVPAEPHGIAGSTCIIGLTADHIAGAEPSQAEFGIEVEPGLYEPAPALPIHVDRPAMPPDGIGIELLGDCRDGALVALWREDLPEDRHPHEIYAEAMPLAWSLQPASSDRLPASGTPVWSGAVLELAKHDSLGRQVFLAQDFSPLNPALISAAAPGSARLVFPRAMIDGVLRTEGFHRASGLPDVRFVILQMPFTDRMTGVIEAARFLVALDLAWEIPERSADNGLLRASEDLIIAPRYHRVRHGEILQDRAPFALGIGTGTERGVLVASLMPEDEGPMAIGSAFDLVDTLPEHGPIADDAPEFLRSARLPPKALRNPQGATPSPQTGNTCFADPNKAQPDVEDYIPETGIIMDFEEGVDAIEFLIDAFVHDAPNAQDQGTADPVDAQAALPQGEGPPTRTDATVFHFHAPGTA